MAKELFFSVGAPLSSERGKMLYQFLIDATGKREANAKPVGTISVKSPTPTREAS